MASPEESRMFEVLLGFSTEGSLCQNADSFMSKQFVEKSCF